MIVFGDGGPFEVEVCEEGMDNVAACFGHVCVGGNGWWQRMLAMDIEDLVSWKVEMS